MQAQPQVQGLFKVSHHETTTAQHHSATKVILGAEYDTTLPEEKRYAQATPWGRIEMIVDNPAALEKLKPGDKFFVGFTRVPESEHAPETAA